MIWCHLAFCHVSRVIYFSVSQVLYPIPSFEIIWLVLKRFQLILSLQSPSYNIILRSSYGQISVKRLDPICQGSVIGDTVPEDSLREHFDIISFKLLSGILNSIAWVFIISDEASGKLSFKVSFSVDSNTARSSLDVVQTTRTW